MDTPPVTEPYISAHPRARITIALLIAGAIVAALTIPIEIATVMFGEIRPDQPLGDNPGAVATALLQVALGLLTIGVYIATVVLFCMWLYRCAMNLRAFGYWQSQIGHSPGWAVGSFFVPFVNLVVPYRATREIWQKSSPNEPGSFAHLESPPRIFPAWWAFWLLSNFASNASMRMTLAGAQLEATAIVGVLGELLSIAAAGFAIMVIKEIDRRQEQASKQIPNLSGPPGPPPPPVFEPQIKVGSGSAGESN